MDALWLHCHASTSTGKPNIHGPNPHCVFSMISLVSCSISCSNWTKSSLELSNKHSWRDWAKHSRKKVSTITPYITKLISLMITLVHIFRPRSKSTCKYSNGNYYFTHLINDWPFRLSLVPIDGTWHVWATLRIIWRYHKLGRFVKSFKRWNILPIRYPYIAT